MECKWCQDDFCVNADCEYCADFCEPEDCEYYEAKNTDSCKKESNSRDIIP